MMRWCPEHARAWVPQGTRAQGALGQTYSARPAQWEAFRPATLLLALTWAQAFQLGHLIRVEEIACDRCTAPLCTTEKKG